VKTYLSVYSPQFLFAKTSLCFVYLYATAISAIVHIFFLWQLNRLSDKLFCKNLSLVNCISKHGSRKLEGTGKKLLLDDQSFAYSQFLSVN